MSNPEYSPEVHQFAEANSVSLEEASQRLAGAALQDKHKPEDLAVRALAKQRGISLAAAAQEIQKEK